MRKKRANRAVFLDRDGTINEEVGYLRRMEQLRVFPEAAEAIRMINEIGMKVVVITNQSGIARGHFDEAFVNSVHERISRILAEGHARVDRYYFCPHHPTEGNPPYVRACSCRKPEAGMLLAAAEELDIDLGRSYLIGDTERDLEAARKAGTRGILVRTGYGADHEAACDPDYVANDILDAVKWILKRIENEKLRS